MPTVDVPTPNPEPGGGLGYASHLRSHGDQFPETSGRPVSRRTSGRICAADLPPLFTGHPMRTTLPSPLCSRFSWRSIWTVWTKRTGSPSLQVTRPCRRTAPGLLLRPRTKCGMRSPRCMLAGMSKHRWSIISSTTGDRKDTRHPYGRDKPARNATDRARDRHRRGAVGLSHTRPNR
jgi:hypothetical protein